VGVIDGMVFGELDGINDDFAVGIDEEIVVGRALGSEDG